MTRIENYIENLTFDNDWPRSHKTYIFTHLELCVTEVDEKYLSNLLPISPSNFFVWGRNKTDKNSFSCAKQWKG